MGDLDLTSPHQTEHVCPVSTVDRNGSRGEKEPKCEWEAPSGALGEQAIMHNPASMLAWKSQTQKTWWSMHCCV